MEAFLEISKSDFVSAEQLQSALQAGPSEIGDPVTCSNTILSLADALRFVDGRAGLVSA
ncbi:MAG: hypothetical protein R3C19_10110 [Planctomycetaceae bacterium]